MGRKPRIWLPDCFYHIVSRGNRREPLFNDQGDYHTFLYIIKQVYEKFPFEIASFCLLSNHYHLQIRSRDVSISKIIGLINKRYADYYNHKNEISGHLFEKRFYDQIITSRLSMLKVSRYIHLNPIEAGIVERMEDYPFSSYRYFLADKMDCEMIPYFKADFLLDHFPADSINERMWLYEQWLMNENLSIKQNS
ncbi:transposase [Saliterribacillus persicus]|uniref:REP element-mobilizing transposase RayT n=1 Tax=Saliterribacillus persicus TaxID=930114 RepID=A0A368YCC3_9BACI|nr:transposase [Saliterribacillus persicus]RCW77329.1 REP element-mobilizing transposase RayT [Saliterribacillus persicus]